LETCPRNYTASDAEPLSFEIAAVDRRGSWIVTIETLEDKKFENRHIKITNLKIWKDHELVQFVHEPFSSSELTGLKCNFLTDKRFVISDGKEV